MDGHGQAQQPWAQNGSAPLMPQVLAPANINHADPAAAEEYATAKELFTREGRLLLATHHP